MPRQFRDSVCVEKHVVVQPLDIEKTKSKTRVQVYRLVLRDPRTPRLAKILLGLAVGYLLLTFDLIPDFIPVIGLLDDLIVVPALVLIALTMIPHEVVEECRRRVQGAEKGA